MAKLKKGSAAAKAFMAKIRAAKGKTKVVKAKAKTKVVKAKIVKTKAKKVGATDFTFKRIDNDVNGNPRYVTSFSNLLTDKENYESGLSVADKYDLAARKAKKIGGKKYNTKQFGGGIVFQSYNIEDTEKKIKSLLNEKVGAVKKATSMHKDTKSHNVNIRVVSGIDGNIPNISIDKIKNNITSIERLNKVLMDNKEKMKFSPYKTIFWQNYFKQKNKEISEYIKTLKKENTSLKKHIK